MVMNTKPYFWFIILFASARIANAQSAPDYQTKSGTYYWSNDKPIELKWGNTRFFRDSTAAKPKNNVDTNDNFSINTITDPQYSNQDISVFPNPFRDKINIKYNKTGDLIVELLDVTGKYAVHKTLSGGDRQIDLSNLAGSTYLLKVFDANSNLLQTFKIEKVN